MKDSFRQLLSEATRLTRIGHLREATAVIQRALRSAAVPAPTAPPPAAARGGAPAESPVAHGEVIDIDARVIDTGSSTATPAAADAPAAPVPADKPPQPPATSGPTAPSGQPTDIAQQPAEPRAGLREPQPSEPAPGEVAPAPEAAVADRGGARSFDTATPDTVGPREEARAPAGRFMSGSFTNSHGTRPYKLFVPGTPATQARPLLVLLHGCKQNPDDFAAGTRMNELAQSQGWVVLYPGQPHTANGSGCWNWFQASDQQRERGEPAILAGMTRHVVATEGIDPRRVYAAGLSAGGAMAAILASTHPDLFAAVGIHSGLPHGAAHDVMTAFSVMRQGPSYGATLAALPAIVFHGDQDRTVHPSNGEALIAQTGPTGVLRPVAAPPPRLETGRAPGGRRYTRAIHLDAGGRPQAEHWVIHGAGHAWSGGSAAGSYTDPKGPDASAEMLRFFAAFRVAEGAAAAA